MGLHADLYIAKAEFELIEDETIDIESIEEVNLKQYKDFSDACNYLEDRLNEFANIAKHLNKEIKSIKEKE